MLRVEAFEGPIARLLEKDQDGEDLGGMQPCRASTVALPDCEQLAVPQGLEALPKRIHRAIQVEYTHGDAPVGLMGPEKPHHNPAGGIALIRDSRYSSNLRGGEILTAVSALPAGDPTLHR